jgi:hypothetical protein
VGDAKPDDYARRCLRARRLVENGTRFVCVVSGGGGPQAEWDAHADIEDNHLRMASWTDKPVAALIKDLKRRGLLDSTIVLWGGEFGRSPESEGSTGRDHHNTGFSMWVAGGGFKRGMAYGATDPIGLKAIENPVHFREGSARDLAPPDGPAIRVQLNYLHLGRKERLTETQGAIVKDIITDGQFSFPHGLAADAGPARGFEVGQEFNSFLIPADPMNPPGCRVWPVRLWWRRTRRREYRRGHLVLPARFPMA